MCCAADEEPSSCRSWKSPHAPLHHQHSVLVLLYVEVKSQKYLSCMNIVTQNIKEWSKWCWNKSRTWVGILLESWPLYMTWKPYKKEEKQGGGCLSKRKTAIRQRLTWLLRLHFSATVMACHKLYIYGLIIYSFTAMFPLPIEPVSNNFSCVRVKCGSCPSSNAPTHTMYI